MLFHAGSILNKKTLFVLMGIFVFSPLSSNIALDYLHLPMSAPELMALPFVVLLYNDIKKIRINWSLFGKFMFLMVLLIIFGLLCSDYSLFAILGTARAYFWLFLFYCIFKKPNNPFTLDDLMFISLGSLMGWLLSSLLGIRNIIVALIDYEATYGSLLAVPLVLSISYIKKKYWILGLSLIVIVLICVTSGIRRLILVSLLSLAMVVLLAIINHPKRIARVTISIFVLGVLLSITLPLLKDVMKETSHTLYHRVFERTETYLEGDIDDSDTGRFEDIIILFEESWRYILPPRGFVSRQTATDQGAGDFNDLPIKELFWTFSLPGALFIIFHFLRRTMMNYSLYRRHENELSFVIVCYMSIMFCLLFLEGTFLAYPYTTPITGACLGIVDKKRS